MLSLIHFKVNFRNNRDSNLLNVTHSSYILDSPIKYNLLQNIDSVGSDFDFFFINMTVVIIHIVIIVINIQIIPYVILYVLSIQLLFLSFKLYILLHFIL